MTVEAVLDMCNAGGLMSNMCRGHCLGIACVTAITPHLLLAMRRVLPCALSDMKGMHIYRAYTQNTDRKILTFIS